MNNLIFSNKRERCPECGARRGFAPYLNAEGGFCHACGYKVLPGIQNHYQAGDRSSNRNTERQPELEQRFIDSIQVEAAQSDLENDTFCAGLLKLGVPEHYLRAWNVGRGRNGRTLFFYQDIKARFTNCKEIVYDPELHRSKTIAPCFTYSKSQGYIAGLFGEHQLSRPGKVILVESEKTAILCAYCMPEISWIATGGTSGLTESKAKVLKGRQILIAFDSDPAGRNNAQRTQEMINSLNISAKIIDLFPGRNDGFDLADYIISQLKMIRDKVDSLPDYEREYFEERAALLEYMSGLSKFNSELQTLEIIKDGCTAN